MALKPWYKVVTPREDLREGKPLDASEFAVHLDKVRDKTALEVYKNPEQFFERTYLTQSLTGLAAEVTRRLSGKKTETSAVFHMITQFGGGKTHALTLLYHLAQNGDKAKKWRGVQQILDKAGVSSIPKAATAVFVGTEFDSLAGRGGNDGTPLRKTPWGEIAFQLGGEKAFSVVAEHDKQFIEPKGDVIRAFLPKDKPCLILMDEIINYVSSYRKKGYHNALYNFIQSLSETARGEENVVLLVSIPASEIVYTTEDEADEQRFKKVLDRVSKAVMMSAESETSEIIRRRLFEWDEKAVTPDGKVLLSKDAVETCKAYAQWVNDYKQHLPSWFPVDHALDAFMATYPFHPTVLSVFERKWQTIQRFQRTRGILRLLALWVSRAYPEGFKVAHKDPLIGLGTAPLEDTYFRPAVFEQLGESKLEGAVTTDICGKKDSNALRLDNEAVDTIKKSRLHRKVATSIFFESNGGQTKERATAPEIRLAVAEPELDIGNVETVLESLTEACYYLTVEGNHYYFSLKENLNKRFADRRANIQSPKIEECVKEEIQKAFGVKKDGIEITFFPQKSSDVLDRAVLTFVVLAPEQVMEDQKKTEAFVDAMTKEYGTSARVFKSALIWCVPDATGALPEEARKALAWEDIQDEAGELRLDEAQVRQLAENVKKARRDLKECVWRTYTKVLLLRKDNGMWEVDIGKNLSSSADSIVRLILERLRHDGEVADIISPNRLIKYWPPAFKEWSTRAVRDAFFSSPQLERPLTMEVIRETIAKGVSSGHIAYVGKMSDGKYEPFIFQKELEVADVEFSDDMFIITAEEAKKHIEPPRLAAVVVSPEKVGVEPGKKQTFVASGLDQHGRDFPAGDVKWKATGGTIDKDGVFHAGKDEGNFVVTVEAGGMKGAAQVAVVKPGTPTLFPVDAPAAGGGTKKLSWVGEIPSQKWMNFYTKVLSKFAAGKGLKLTLKVEVSPEDGVSTQKVDETKVALRELGLGDDVKVE